ncbi:MAG TPA: hypothetical protein VKA91_05440, partial [Nitrososphaeraceae archaeon]|nr:hypothetical protein [Nitrososphaeraceae archaeon]
ELDDNVKKIVLYHEKGDIESRIHLAQPPKEWEELWTQNIQNYSKLTLYCKCRNCYEKYPILIDYFDYRKGLLPSGILKKDCSRCNSKSTVEVYSDISKIT